jgi:hypothetical protein
MGKTEIILCDCYSPEHQIIVHYDNDENELGEKYPMIYLYVHLNKLPFWKRLKYGIKYIFGRKSRYGAFEEFIVNPEDIDKFENIVSHLKNNKKVLVD